MPKIVIYSDKCLPPPYYIPKLEQRNEVKETLGRVKIRNSCGVKNLAGTTAERGADVTIVRGILIIPNGN